jgi:hypothetical protein
MTFTDQQKAKLMEGARRNGITPANCPHCEFDRRFPGFKSGGWIEPYNNGPIGPCPMCNADGSHPRDGGA